MTIQEFYKYSWFSNLSYVDWNPAAVGLDKDPVDAARQAILDANAPGVERVPGNVAFSKLDSLGEKIFLPVTDGGKGWRVADFRENNPDTGFSASLFQNSTTGEKVLAIRGTEGGGPAEQIFQDLLRADLSEIGLIGMALSQTVSMFNYIQQLQAESDNDHVLRLELKVSPLDGLPPDNVNSIQIIPGINIWFEVYHDVQGLGLISETDNLTITGHSLGGHLAAIGQRLFPELFDQTITYNAPGYDPETADIGGPILASLINLLPAGPLSFLTPLLASGAHQLTNQIISQLFAPHLPFDKQPVDGFGELSITSLVSEDVDPGDDISIVSSYLTGTPFSAHQFVATERNSHLIEPFMDELAVQALLEKIDPNIDLAGAELIYKVASNNAGKSGESILDALSKLVLLDKPPVTVSDFETGIKTGIGIGKGNLDDRGAVHTRIIELEQIIDSNPEFQGLTITPLITADNGDAVAQSAETLEQAARTSLAHRYALVNLNPFVITGNDNIYNGHNKNGELDLFDQSTGQGALTDQYLEDRAAFLALEIELGLSDRTSKNNGSENITYIDEASNLTLDISRPTGSGQFVHQQIVFTGSKAGEIATGRGNSKNDRLYGFTGNDILTGGRGSDVLEGGMGDDTLYSNNFELQDDGVIDTLKGGEGEDIYYVGDGDEIEDSDRRVQFIEHRGVVINGAYVQQDDGSYKNQANNNLDLVINDTSATFILTKDKKVTGFRILNFKDEEQAFHDGDFNITLLGHSPAPPEEFTLTDDVDVLGVDETGTILELFDKVGGVVTDTVTLTSPPGNLVTEKRGQIYF